MENYFVEKIYEKNIIFNFFFAASVLQAAEFEVVDQLTVNGATTLKSSVVVIVSNLNLPLSLWVSTSATTPHLYVSTNGNVGIGTTTPGAKLEILTTAAADPVFKLGSAGVSDYQSMMIYNGSGSNSLFVTGGPEEFISGTGTGDAGFRASTGKKLFFGTADGAGLVVSGGNVGIGTTSPATKLHISSGTLTIDGNEDTSINVLGDISAARYQINGSTMVAILPGIDSIAYGVYAGASNITGGNYNTFIGNYAGQSNTTGAGNSFLGFQAGYLNITGQYNSFLGYSAGGKNTTGISNSFLGYKAGRLNTEGSNNSFVGYQAGYSNTTGISNSFVGYQAGYSNTTGNYNSFLGVFAGYLNTTGHDNSFLGYQAGYNTTTGDYNSFMGYQAGYANTTGGYNSFLGSYAGLNNTEGVGNSFLGSHAGQANTTGANNSFLGTYAGPSNTTGFYNSFMGYKAGYFNTTGANNSFLGTFAGYSNTTGEGNSFLGYFAGRSNTTASNNSFLGSHAGYSNTTGSYNSFLGYFAGYSNTTGQYNSFVGTYAGKSNTTGANNSFVGFYAGTSNTTGAGNSFLGYFAGYYNETGSANAIFGNEAGYGVSGSSFSSSTIVGVNSGDHITTGSNNVLLGFQAGNSITTGHDNIIIGYDEDTPSAITSSHLNIGGAIYGDLSTGNVGIGTTSPGAKLDVNGTIKANVITYGGTAGTDFTISNPYTGKIIIDGEKGTNLRTFVAGTGWVDRLTVLVGGNVGIGTTAPVSKLGVVGGADAWAASFFGLSTSNQVRIGTLNGVATIGANNNAGTVWADLSINPIGNTLFGGNVGIGTTGPSYKLEVDGGSAETRLRVSTTGTDAKEAGIILSNSSKTAYNDGLEISQGGGYTRFDDLIGNEIMRLMPQSGTVGNTYFAGNVGIGTMSPGAKLEVNGVLKASQPYWTGTFGVITGTDFIQGLVETASSGITLSGGNTLTVSITGLYLIHGQQLTLGTGSTYFAVEKNDSTLMHAYTSYLSTIDLAIDTITQFNAGDTIKFHYTGSSVSTTWGGVHSSAYVYFLR